MTVRARGNTATAHWLREGDPGTVARIATRIVDRRLAVEAFRDCYQVYRERVPSAECCSQRCTHVLLMLVDQWRTQPCRSAMISVSKALGNYYATHLGADDDPVGDLAHLIEYSEGDDGVALAGLAAQVGVQRMCAKMRAVATGEAHEPLTHELLTSILRSRIPYPRAGALVGSGRGCFVLDLGCRTELGWRRGPWWIAMQCEPRLGRRGGVRWNGYLEGPASEVVHCIPDSDLMLQVYARMKRIDEGEESAQVEFAWGRKKRRGEMAWLVERLLQPRLDIAADRALRAETAT